MFIFLLKVTLTLKIQTTHELVPVSFGYMLLQSFDSWIFVQHCFLLEVLITNRVNSIQF